MFKFLTKLYTATIYLKSGNSIVVRDITEYCVKHVDGKPTKIDFTYYNPKPGLFVDMGQVEAVTMKVQ